MSVHTPKKSTGYSTHRSARFTLVKTACRPASEEPSEMTANATFFCRRMLLTQPLTVTDAAAGVDGGDASSWRMVGARDELAEDRKRRASIVVHQSRRDSVGRRPDASRVIVVLARCRAQNGRWCIRRRPLHAVPPSPTRPTSPMSTMISPLIVLHIYPRTIHITYRY